MAAFRTVISKVLFVWLAVVTPQRSYGQNSEFPAPTQLRRPLTTNFTLIYSGSPPDPYRVSQESMQLNCLGKEEPQTDDIMNDIRAGLQFMLETRNDYTFPIHGTGTTAAHAVMDNMVEQGDKVLVLITGEFGEIIANMSRRLGGDTIVDNKTPGTRYTLQEFENLVKQHQPKIAAIVQGESSTGVYQPIEGFGEVCQRYGCYFIVDIVSMVGIQRVKLDEWKVDCAYASSHKGLGGVVGLGLVSCSDRAVEKIKARKYLPRAFQTDLIEQRQIWLTPLVVRKQSQSLPLFYALREALGLIVREGKDKVFQRHLEATRRLMSGLMTMGLKYFVPNPEDRLISFTTVTVPPTKSVEKIVDFMYKRYKIMVSDGVGPTEGKILRIVNFAANTDKARVDRFLTSLRIALLSLQTNK